ncbi:hypothetical protein [Fundidesulfovibrio agrisoli]|uniref:hypothetical protein n=1 Tax=Fundidesulfovibrio agrisoli TaxID=2922717 RepID=UPI001FAB99FD|nr:hypothetical protein [Fundidesulfovibrio agrisoli]
MRKRHLLTSASLLLAALILSGCLGRTNYTRLDPRCRDWTRSGVRSWQFAESGPDMDTFYEYYMCKHAYTHHMIGDTTYFESHPEEALDTIRRKIPHVRSNNELNAVIRLLHQMLVLKLCDQAEYDRLTAQLHEINKTLR